MPLTGLPGIMQILSAFNFGLIRRILVRPKRVKILRSLRLIAILAFTGCVSESQVYEWDLKPTYVSAYARRLPGADREQIAKVMAHRTSQPIICLCETRDPKRPGGLFAYTGYIGAKERGQFGFFTLQKADGIWRIIKGGTDIDPILVCLLCNGL